MTSYIIVIFCVICALFFWRVESDLINPISLFCILWALCVFLAALRLYDLHETSETVYLYILLGCISYVIGSMFGRIVRITKKETYYEKIDNGSAFYINYKLWYVFIAIICLYSLWRLGNILVYLQSGYSWWNIRLLSTTGEGGSGTIRGSFIFQAIYNWVVSPIVYILSPTMLIEFIAGKRNKLFIGTSLGAIVLYSICTVSRSIWGFSIIYLVVLLFIFRNRIKLTPKIKKILRKIPILIIILFGIIVYITFMRNADASILTNAYAYFAGGIPLFDIHLHEAISQSRTYGMLSLAGFLYPVFFIFHLIGFKYPNAFLLGDAVKANLENFITIGSNITMNAYATLFYDFYIDFGVIGIAVGSFIFGYLCMRAYKSMKNNMNMVSLVTYLILCQYILFSMARIYSSLTTRAISFIWIPILLSNRKLFRIGNLRCKK